MGECIFNLFLPPFTFFISLIFLLLLYVVIYNDDEKKEMENKKVRIREKRMMERGRGEKVYECGY